MNFIVNIKDGIIKYLSFCYVNLMHINSPPNLSTKLISHLKVKFFVLNLGF